VETPINTLPGTSSTQPNVPVPSTYNNIENASETSGEFIFDPGDSYENPSLQPETVITEPVTTGVTSVDGGISSRGRQRTLSRAMQESIAQKQFYGSSGMHYMASSATTSEDTTYADEDEFHDWHLELQERMSHPIAFHAEMMGDIMYLHQALRQPDAAEFVKAVVKEVNGHVENGNWQLVRRDQVPPDVEVMPSVWAMRRKRNLTTNAIVKYKARLNLHGGKQIYGMNYYETYAPVVTWFAIRLLLIIAILLSLALRQIDFIMAYPQADIEMDMYMGLPLGIEVAHGNSKDYVLKLLKNLYGQKQAGRVWNEHLVEKLRSIGFSQSFVDECVFYREDVIFIVYVDDGIFIGKSDEQLTSTISSLNYKILV